MNILRRIFGRPYRSRKMLADCGHETLTEGAVTVNGKTVSVHCSGSSISYCLSCLEKLATSCAHCGKPILPDAPVLRKTVREGREEFIGVCCTEMGTVDCTGRWTEEGYNKVPFEELLEVTSH